MFVQWKTHENAWKELIVVVITCLFGLAVGLLPFIDNFSHIGGFLVGVLTSFMFYATPGKNGSFWMVLKGVGAVLLVVLFLIGYVVFFAAPDAVKRCEWCVTVNCLPVLNWCTQRT